MLSPLQVPFTALQGEGVEYLGHANDAVIAISNYRLHLKFKDSVINVSLPLPVPPPLAGFQSREGWECPIPGRWGTGRCLLEDASPGRAVAVLLLYLGVRMGFSFGW